MCCSPPQSTTRQYLLGGYKFIFFSAMDAIGHSRYLPIVVYEKGAPERCQPISPTRWKAASTPDHPFWTPIACMPPAGARSTIANLAVEHLQKARRSGKRIGIEPGFLPSDAYIAHPQGRLPDAKLIDATGMLGAHARHQDRCRTRQAAHASELITDSMLATIAWAQAKARPRARSSSSCGVRKPIAECISNIAC
jgi:Xaa-Pro dipeptidase